MCTQSKIHTESESAGYDNMTRSTIVSAFPLFYKQVEPIHDLSEMRVGDVCVCEGLIPSYSTFHRQKKILHKHTSLY